MNPNPSRRRQRKPLTVHFGEGFLGGILQRRNSLQEFAFPFFERFDVLLLRSHLNVDQIDAPLRTLDVFHQFGLQKIRFVCHFEG